MKSEIVNRLYNIHNRRHDKTVHNHVCVVTEKKKIVSFGVNTIESHAETTALAKYRKRRRKGKGTKRMLH